MSSTDVDKNGNFYVKLEKFILKSTPEYISDKKGYL